MPSVVVVPERGRALVVLILERRRPRFPFNFPFSEKLVPEELVTTSLGCEPERDIVGRGQIPSLRESIAFLRGAPAVQVGHDRHRSGVRAWCGSEHWTCIPVLDATWWVGPVERRVYR